MPKFGQLAITARRFFPWRGLLVCLAVICLDAHLANRFHLPLSGNAVVQANSAKVQHMDRDGFRWLPPRLSLSPLFVPLRLPPPLTPEAGYMPPRVHSLYDRPPPAFS